MTHALLVGPDRGLASALEARGVTMTRLTDAATGTALEDAAVSSADLFILTDVNDAILIPIAKDRNNRLQIIVYAPDSIPEYVRRQVDFAVDPDLLTPDIVAEELTGTAA